MTDRPPPLSAQVLSEVDDPSRLRVLHSLDILDSERDFDFDDLTNLAAELIGAPMALVTLVDSDRQWFKSRVGLDVSELPTETSFCAHALADRDNDCTVVLNALDDPRFAHNPHVTGWPYIRFYAGAPIVVRGERLGTLCVFAPEPRSEFPNSQRNQLVRLARLAGSLFELKDEARVRARTAAALRKEEWQHALTLEAGRVGSWVWDIASDEIVGNDIFLRMFGLTAGTKHTASEVFGLIRPDDLPRVNEALQLAFDSGADYVSEYRLSHSSQWLVARGRVYQRDADGKPLVMMGINLDITDTREAADAMRVLLRELNHRVKNTLAMIQSLARQSLRSNPDPRAFMNAFSGRLRTLVDAHSLLSDYDWSGVSLLALVRTQLAAGAPTDSQIEIDGPDVMLPPDQALGLGMVLHELATNAAQFGALSVPEGRVEVRWHETPNPSRRIVLEWIEQHGPAVSAPRERGLGTRLIERGLDKVLDSRVALDFDPDGVHAQISFPIPDQPVEA